MPEPKPTEILVNEEHQPDVRDADQLLTEIFGNVNERLTQWRGRVGELNELPQFFDRTGQPIASLAARDTGTVLSLRRNTETGAVQIDLYAGSEAARRREPAVSMTVSYQERDGAVTERKEVTDFTQPPPRTPTTMETTRGTTPGDLAISINTGSERQSIGFRKGVPERLEVVQYVNGEQRVLSFSFAGGQITGVRVNGAEISGPAARAFIEAAQETLAAVALENDLEFVSTSEPPEDEPGASASKPLDKPAAKPAEKLTAPVDKVADKGADKPADKAAEKSTALVDKVADKGADKPADKPPEKSTVPAAKDTLTDKPLVKPADKPIEKPSGKSGAPDAAPVSVPFRVAENVPRRAPEAARDGDRLRAGTYEGNDGSRIEYAMAPDGRVRPRAITFRDGSRSEYTYNEEGKVLEVVNKNPRNEVVSRWFTEDDGETYRQEAGGRRSEPVEGTFATRDDGTFAFRSSNALLETLPDGTIVRRFQAADGPRETYIRPDGTELQLVTIGGNLRPGRAILPDRTRIEYIYDGTNRPSDVIMMLPNGQQTRSESRDGGASWTERPSGRVGALTLQEGYRPQFNAREGAERPPEVRELPRPSDKPGPMSDRDRTLFLQQRLSAVLEGMYAPRFAQEQQRIYDEAVARARESRTSVNQDQVRRQVEDAHRRLNEQMAADRRALASEMELISNAPDARAAWARCPVTQRVYRDCVNWLEQQAIPAALRRLTGPAGTDVPPGSPVPVPQQDGLFLIPELFRARGATGGLPRPDFGIAGVRPDDSRPLQLPGESDLASLGRGFTWLSEAQRRLDRQRLDYELNVLLPDIITRNGMPNGWLQEVGRDPEQRRAALREMVDLTLQVRNYATAIVTLGLDRTGVANLPPGCNPVIEGAHPNRRVTRLNLDLPQNLDMQNPENLRRIEALRNWLRDNGPRVEQSMQEWAASQDPSRQVFFGEIQTTGRVMAGPDGRPTEILDPRDPRNRERLSDPNCREFNLLDCGFSVRRQGGQIYLDSTIQPRDASWYNYLNIGAPAVGQPFVHARGPFNPTDPVAIRDSSGRTHIIQAQNLEGWLREQQFMHYGSKVLTATMDIGMVVASGGSGVTAAAAWRAGTIAGGAAVRHMAVAGARGVLGGSGFFLNNAAAHSSDFWRTVNDVRGVAMTFDVAQGTARQLGGGALRWLRGTEAAGALTTAQRIEQAIGNAGWVVRGVHGAERGAHIVMEVANVPYMPLIYHDVSSHVQHLREAGQPSPFDRAARLIQDGRDQAPRPRDASEAAARQTQEAARRTLDTYCEQLCRGKDEATQGRIRELFQRAGRMMDPAAAPADKAAFRRELMELMYGSSTGLGEQIKNEELRRGRALSAEEIRNLRNSSFTPDREMQAAAAAAYLFVSREANGRLPDTLATRPVTVPAYERSVPTGRGSARVPVAERTVNQTITPADIMAMLRQDVCTTDSPARRMVTGDLLVRAGERTPLSYAAILRDIASDTTASNRDRMDAIMRLAPMISDLHLAERRAGAPGAGYGVSAADLERVLREAAGNERDNPNIRALAASTLQILRSEFETDRVSAAMAAVGRQFIDNGGLTAAESRFSRDTVTQLRQGAESTDPVIRLRAVLALRDLGNQGGMTDSRVFNQAVVACITDGQHDLNLQALRALRVADPARDLRPEDRARIALLLEQDTTRAGTPVKLEILGRLADFATTTDERSRVARYVEMMIDSGNTRLYAADPELRVAAVRAIGQMNIQNETAVTAVRARLNPATEPDARVRLAALQTLERLRVPGLQQICITALRTESDAAVRAALVDVRAQNTRPIRDERYMEAIQAHQAALAESQRNNTFDAAAWLRNHTTYTLLNSDAYANLLRERSETPPSTNWWQRNMPFPYVTGSLTAAELEQRRAGARIDVSQERQSQFNALAREAAQVGAAGHNARMALLFIATGDNPPFGSEEVPIFREWAAQQIRHLCQTGSEVRGEFLKGIQEGLLSTRLAAGTRAHLLEALVHFVENAPAGPSLALERFFDNPRSTSPDDVMRAYATAGITAPPQVRQALTAYMENQNATTRAAVITAIEANVNTSSALYRQTASLAVADALTRQFRSLPTESQPQYQQTMQLQQRMIELLRQWNYHSAYPALEAASRSHPYPQIREIATQSLSDMRDRITPVWERTRPDTDTPPTQRAQALERALIGGNADDLVQALFTAARGRPVAAGTDPRVNLYRRAIRDGGIEPDRPRQEGTRWHIDGAEKVRLAAARVMLERNERGEFINPGFSDEDRRRAAEVIARTAFEGSLPGYKQDALALLQRELAAPPNPLMLVALRDMVLANPSYDRTLTIDGRATTLRQLLETNFRGDATGIAGGNGTRTRQTGRGTLEEEYRGGQLVRATETLQDGTVITTRRAGRAFVIEEFKNGQVERTVTPTGRTYASILLDDQTQHGASMESRMLAATRLLTNPRVAPTEAERRSALDAMHTAAGSGPEAERLQWAHYLAYGAGIDNVRDRDWRDRGFVAINNLAARATDEGTRRQAMEHVARYTQPQVTLAIRAMLDDLNADITRAAQLTRERNTAGAIPARYRESNERYQEALRRAGIQPPPRLPDITPDVARTTQTLTHLSRLYEQNGRTPADTAALVQAYVAASGFMQPTSEVMTRLRAQVQQAVADIATRRLEPSDPRLPAFTQFLDMPGTANDALKLQLADTIVTAPGLTHTDRMSAWRRLAAFTGHADETIRNGATAAFDRIQPSSAEEVTRIRGILLRAGQTNLYSEDRAEKARFWNHYLRFIERTSTDRTSREYEFVRNRATEFARPGVGAPTGARDAVADAERLAEEAIRDRLPSRACGFFEQALAAREARDGANSVELAQARLRYAEFLRTSAESRGRLPDTTAIIRQQELATGVLRTQAPDSLETAAALRTLVASYTRFNPGENFQRVAERAEDALAAAAGIYERTAGTRDHGQYAACLADLAAVQLRRNRPQEAYRTFEKLIELSNREGMPAAQRTEVLRSCFERARSFMGGPHGTEALAAAQQLLGRVNGIDGIPGDRREALAESIWWIGRNLAEGGRAADGYQYFDRALEQYEAAFGERGGNLTGMMDFYAGVLERNGQNARAQQLRERIRTIHSRPR